MRLHPPPQIGYYLDEFSGHCCDILLGFTLLIRSKYFSRAMDEIHSFSFEVIFDFLTLDNLEMMAILSYIYSFNF